ncbi:MAG: TRAP transporter small permease subunit [Geminicoccaceae bacterium]
MTIVTRFLSRLAESVAALMMAAIFLTFILQIAVRYIVGSSWFLGTFGNVVDAAHFGWTVEFIMVLWLWTIFWGNSFIVRERDHVTFDILYLSVRPGLRRWFAVIGAVAIAVALWSSISPTHDKMKLLRLKSSATLPVKMLPIYSIYFLFLAVVGARYAWRAFQALRGRDMNDHQDPGALAGDPGENAR